MRSNRSRRRWHWRAEVGLRPSVLMPITVVVTLMIASVHAAAQTCQQLWVERNSYYKAHGYCFKTQRAIEHFGNGGCFINNEGDVPLTAAERRRIEEIKSLERRMSCSEEDSGPRPGPISCQQVWVERNSMYKAKGYCFKTRRAIEYFG